MGNFFSDESSRKIVKAIGEIEKQTIAELRVHIDDVCDSDPLERALEVFHKLKMDRTELRSGVLIYASTEDKKIAILGDKGIDDKVDPSYWNQIVHKMTEEIHRKDLADGIILGLKEIGAKLIQFFPDELNRAVSKKDELPNEISYG